MNTRPAQIKDIPEIVALGKTLLEKHLEFDQEYYTLEEHFDQLFSKWVEEQINQPNQLLLVSENQLSSKIVGFISGFIKALYPWFRIKSVGHISYLVIDQGFQHQGIGRLLESEALVWFKGKNVSYIELYSDEKNSSGVAAWHSYGYQPFKYFLRKKMD